MQESSKHFEFPDTNRASTDPFSGQSDATRIAELEQDRAEAEQGEMAQKQRAEQAEAARDEFQQRLLDELAKNALTPTGRDRLEQAEADRNACAEAYENETNLRLKAEAALAERDARKCEDCEACDHCSVQNVAWVRFGPEPDFACNRWTDRAEEGSHDSVPTDQQIRDARMDEAIPLEEDFS